MYLLVRIIIYDIVPCDYVYPFIGPWWFVLHTRKSAEARKQYHPPLDAKDADIRQSACRKRKIIRAGFVSPRQAVILYSR